MQKEEQLLIKRLCELSKTAYHRNIVTYSDFLNLNEQNILHSLPKDQLYTRYETFGGYELAERQMVAFIPDALYCEMNYPMSVLRIAPLQSKFGEELTHRDYLGAILNLGIDRSKVGDILVEGKEATLFLAVALTEFIQDELTRVRHTSVMVTETLLTEFDYRPRYEELLGTVASVRLDSLLSLAFNSSRSKLTGLIEGGKVFVNGKLMISNSYQPKEEDVISVRGRGKFRYNGIRSQTKKNRLYISIHKYI